MTKRTLRILPVLAIITIFSCKKPSNVGTSLLPDDDDLSLLFNDTTTLRTQTLSEDPQRTDRMQYQYLGNINDANFGFSRASVLGQLTILSNVTEASHVYTLDSAVLFLNYIDFIGDTTVPQNLVVYKVDQAFGSDTIHSSSETPMIGGEIGRANNYYFKPNVKTKLSFTDTVGSAAMIRIKMNSYFAYGLLSQLGTNTMSSNLNFTNYLPGIYVTTEGSGGKGMAKVNLFSTKSKLVLYYKSETKDSLTRDFPAYLSLFNFNKFEHIHAGSPVAAYINTGNPSGDDLSYVQGQAGLKTLVEFPNIASYGKISVNKAELVITQIYDEDSKYITPPPQITALKKDTTGKSVNFTTLQSLYAGGIADSTTDGMGHKIYKYKINITTYLQDLIIGKEKVNGLYIYTNSVPSTALTLPAVSMSPFRLIFAGSNNPDPSIRIKLNLKYTRIE